MEEKVTMTSKTLNPPARDTISLLGWLTSHRQQPFCASEIRFVVWWHCFLSAGLLERGNCGGVTIRANGRLNSL